eukprot:3254222-Pleurochrysis_carterae.AAC.3
MWQYYLKIGLRHRGLGALGDLPSDHPGALERLLPAAWRRGDVRALSPRSSRRVCGPDAPLEPRRRALRRPTYCSTTRPPAKKIRPGDGG